MLFIPMNDSFEFEKIISLDSNCPTTFILGRCKSNSESTRSNLLFHSRVVSRNHALLFFKNDKLYLKDTKSSSGTFVNSKRLSSIGEESLPFEILDGDMIMLGEDCTSEGGIHLLNI